MFLLARLPASIAALLVAVLDRGPCDAMCRLLARVVATPSISMGIFIIGMVERFAVDVLSVRWQYMAYTVWQGISIRVRHATSTFRQQKRRVATYHGICMTERFCFSVDEYSISCQLWRGAMNWLTPSWVIYSAVRLPIGRKLSHHRVSLNDPDFTTSTQG